MFPNFHAVSTVPSTLSKWIKMVENQSSQPITLVPDLVQDIVMLNAHMISSISMVKLTCSVGIHLQLTQVPVQESTVPAVPKWTSGRPTNNLPKSPLIPAQSKVKHVVKAKTAVTTHQVTDTMVSVTRMVAILTHSDSERPTSTVQVASTLSTLPKK
jgi:hypothetical protein